MDLCGSTNFGWRRREAGSDPDYLPFDHFLNPTGTVPRNSLNLYNRVPKCDVILGKLSRLLFPKNIVPNNGVVITLAATSFALLQPVP